MQKIVSEIVVRQRLNNRLAARGECLRKHRVEARWPNHDDEYYIAVLNTDQVVSREVSLEDLARKEGVIRLGESMVAK